MNTLRFVLPDVNATLELGRALAELLREPGAPRAVMLHGDLGSGKTTLVRGLVLALPGGDDAEVASPSFTIVNMYSTKPPVMHADLFRCPPGTGIPEELEDALDRTAGTAEPAPLVFVEWPDNLSAVDVPAKRLDILLEPCQSSRLFSAAAQGEAAERVCAGLAAWVAATHPDWLDNREN